MSERSSGLGVLITTIFLLTLIILLALDGMKQESELRDLQRRVGELESRQ